MVKQYQNLETTVLIAGLFHLVVTHLVRKIFKF